MSVHTDVCLCLTDFSALWHPTSFPLLRTLPASVDFLFSIPLISTHFIAAFQERAFSSQKIYSLCLSARLHNLHPPEVPSLWHLIPSVSLLPDNPRMTGFIGTDVCRLADVSDWKMYMHTHSHTHMHTHTHSHTHMHTHAHAHAHAHAYTRTHTDTDTHTHTHSDTQTHTLTHSLTLMHACMHACTHARMHARTHTHTHTQTCMCTRAHARMHTHTH